jgi:hypothetical protein
MAEKNEDVMIKRRGAKHAKVTAKAALRVGSGDLIETAFATSHERAFLDALTNRAKHAPPGPDRTVAEPSLLHALSETSRHHDPVVKREGEYVMRVVTAAVGPVIRVVTDLREQSKRMT